MAIGLDSNSIFVVCDHDALFSAIELALSFLPGISVTRMVTGYSAAQRPGALSNNADLVIVAAAALTSDPFTMLSDAGLLGRVGETPILILSDRPSRAETDDRITYLDFPFDMDQLTTTVQDLLDEQPAHTLVREKNHGR